MESTIAIWKSWGGAKRWSFVCSALLVLVVGAWAFWQLSNPDYVELPVRFDPADAGKVVETLDSAKIAFELSDDGAHVRVPEPRVGDARAKLAANGLPSGGRVGFETFDESSLGATDFAQRVNLQRALQGELERSIESLLGMEGVRVHLSLGSNRGLLQDRKDAKASVIVPLDYLSSAQVRSVQGVVAGAVEGLATTAVSVVGRNGRGLSAGDTLNALETMDDLASDRRSHEEARIRQRLEEMLAGFAAQNAIRLSVAVELDPDRVDLQREAPLQSAALGSEGTPTATQREQRSSPPGRVSQISIAVAMPEPAVEREGMERLIAAAAGLRTERGDRLALLYHQMTPEELLIERVEALPATTQPRTMATPSPSPSAPSPHMVPVPAWVGLGLAGLLLASFAWRRRAGLSREVSVVDADLAFERARAWLVDGTR